jgi:hypothetical protein
VTRLANNDTIHGVYMDFCLLSGINHDLNSSELNDGLAFVTNGVAFASTTYYYFNSVSVGNFF